jgi:hypothetical protein
MKANEPHQFDVEKKRMLPEQISRGTPLETIEV